jgi:hypothetical protein
LVVLTILKNMSSSMGRMTSHIVLWKIKAMFETTNQQQYIGDYTTIQQYCNISILSAYYQHIISIYPIIARIPWPAVGSIQRKPRHFLGCWSLASTWFGWL